MLGLELIHGSKVCPYALTHWDRVKYIRVSTLTVIVSDNGLSSGRGQAIIWNNAGIKQTSMKF